MQSRNIVFSAPGCVSLKAEALTAPQKGEVQCKAVRSLISTGTEVRCLRGVFDPGTNWESWVQYPFHPGYSMVAQVVAVGEGVTGFQPGNRVFAHAPHCEYFNVDAKLVNLIPPQIPDSDAVWTTMGRVTQNGVRRANIQLGDYVVVIGSGIVGLMSMQFAKIAGADGCIVIDTSRKGLELAGQLGANYTIPAPAGEAAAEVARITDGRMADVVIDATGNPLVLADACTLARKNGKVLIIGDTTQPHKQALGPGVISNYLTIMGAHAKMFVDEENPFFPYTWARIHQICYDYMLQGRLCVKGLSTLEAAPQDMPALYARLLEDTRFATGIQIDWSKLPVL